LAPSKALLNHAGVADTNQPVHATHTAYRRDEALK